jgi:plastocyanin
VDAADEDADAALEDAGRVVNGCRSYVDATAEDASRALSWVDEIADSPERCLRVRAGQTVIFVGDFDEHPLAPRGGDTPNPIEGQTTFTEPGVYGYYCPVHPSMNGAIWVEAS